MSSLSKRLAHQRYVKRMSDLRGLLDGLSTGKTISEIAKLESLDEAYLMVIVNQWKLGV